jgi:hypothetical protein
MTERERLTVLIEECTAIHDSGFDPDKRISAEALARYLLSNGVVLPPVKVGQTVYQTDGFRVYESVVRNVIYDTDGIAFDDTAIGRFVFLTREDAEEEVKKRSKL